MSSAFTCSNEIIPESHDHASEQVVMDLATWREDFHSLSRIFAPLLVVPLHGEGIPGFTVHDPVTGERHEFARLRRVASFCAVLTSA